MSERELDAFIRAELEARFAGAYAKRCLHVDEGGEQCEGRGWCPIHGDVDEYHAPTTPTGIYIPPPPTPRATS